jgi:hypothetical protein
MKLERFIKWSEKAVFLANKEENNIKVRMCITKADNFFSNLK